MCKCACVRACGCARACGQVARSDTVSHAQQRTLVYATPFIISGAMYSRVPTGVTVLALSACKVVPHDHPPPNTHTYTHTHTRERERVVSLSTWARCESGGGRDNNVRLYTQ
jgi:hypothetical protein